MFVTIDQQHVVALAGSQDGEVDGDGGLAGATLRIPYRDDHRGLREKPCLQAADRLRNAVRFPSCAEVIYNGSTDGAEMQAVPTKSVNVLKVVYRPPRMCHYTDAS